MGAFMRSLIALFLVLMGASGLRLACLETGLPQTRDPDSVIVGQALVLEHQGHWGADKVSALYPAFLADSLAILPGKLRTSLGDQASLEEHLAAARRPDLLARRWLALLSLLALPAVWALARRWSSALGATIACAFLATALTHVVFTRMARPHGAVTAFGVLTIWALGWSLQRPGWGPVLLTGALAGLCVGCLHSGAAVLIPCLVACIWQLRSHGRVVLPKLISAIALAAAIVLWSYRFVGDKGVFDRRVMDNPLDGSGWHAILDRLWHADPVLLVASAIGLGFVLLRLSRPANHGPARSVAWLCAIHALPYLFAIGLYRWSWLRFSLVLFPYLALLAALPFDALARTRPRLATCAALASLALPTWASARYVWVQSQPSILTVAAEVVEDIIEPGERVILSSTATLPVAQRRESLSRMPRFLLSPWEAYLLRRPSELPLDSIDIRYLSSDRGEAWPPSEARVAEKLRASGARLAVVHTHEPMALQAVEAAQGKRLMQLDPLPVGSDATREYSLLRYALDVKRMGRRTRIYSLPETAHAR